VVDADSAASLFENIADLFEQSAADGTTIREVVGEDPVEFIEALIRNYPEGDWRILERQRLISAIARAAGEDTGKEERSVCGRRVRILLPEPQESRPVSS
jgi:Protein of unknown function (DUF1048)